MRARGRILRAEGQVFRAVGDDGTAFALSPCGDIAAGKGWVLWDGSAWCHAKAVHRAWAYDDSSNKWAKVADGQQLELQNGERCEPDATKNAPKVKITLACKPACCCPSMERGQRPRRPPCRSLPFVFTEASLCTACAGGCKVPASSDAAPEWSNLTAKQMSILRARRYAATATISNLSLPQRSQESRPCRCGR